MGTKTRLTLELTQTHTYRHRVRIFHLLILLFTREFLLTSYYSFYTRENLYFTSERSSSSEQAPFELSFPPLNDGHPDSLRPCLVERFDGGYISSQFSCIAPGVSGHGITSSKWQVSTRRDPSVLSLGDVGPL